MLNAKILHFQIIDKEIVVRSFLKTLLMSLLPLQIVHCLSQMNSIRCVLTWVTMTVWCLYMCVLEEVAVTLS